MIEWEFSHIPFDGDSSDEKIVCQKCGWTWKVKDGGDDLYICHKCNADNSKFYLDNEVFSNIVDPNLIVKSVTELAKLGGSIAQAKATKESSKLDIEREIEVRCGKKPKLKKKKKEYNTCLNNYLSSLDTKQRQDFQEKKKQSEFQRKAFAETQKNKINTTFIVVGIFAVILGIVVYKKFKK